MQAAVAAGVAWQLSMLLLDLLQTIFAPFAAIVALLGCPGGRGRRALMVVGGMAVGVLVGEALNAVLGSGALPVAPAALAWVGARRR